MNRRNIANLVLHTLVVLAIPRFSAAQPVFYTARSLEYRTPDRSGPGALGTAAVAAVHGPTMELTSVDLLIELGGDSTPELLRLFVDARRGFELPRSGDAFKGAWVQGFTLFTWAEGEPVLVFHAANEFDGFSLKLQEIEGRPMLISEGDREHMQYAWGRFELWDSGIEIWAARCRSVKVEPENWQEGWHNLPLIHSPRSK